VVLRRGGRRRKLSRAETARFVELLASLPIEVEDAGPSHSLGPVLELGRASGLSACDSAYLDLAMRLGAPLATLDRNLQAAAKAAGVDLFVAGKGG
jgi:predicted nucleic acid-binding protein